MSGSSNSEAALKTAMMIVRDELLKQDEIYEGFLCSIKSALDDIKGSMNHEDTAKVILDRIIGEE